jgi:hypothetical protein
MYKQILFKAYTKTFSIGISKKSQETTFEQIFWKLTRSLLTSYMQENSFKIAATPLLLNLNT